ncbi:hypothetical protein [Paludisphaera borealis]|uniref:O-Antigen ligase n=1 Tax=Paludisphaera borealis TaxID=1387353 RepID=A0A1U7CRV0_9BACT|nr:hypothetical protein [Paludisphaera borealis]APW61661.1 hypothetical protein BSF38_03186 [Paludisphaera borealis]MDR3620365.1 O-antigen ligase domain-containing protein [Paludisphaera borealis]
MNARQKILAVCDRLLGWLLAAVILGATLGFGGTAWWFRPWLVAGVTVLVLLKLLQDLLVGRTPILKTPLGLLGLAALALAVVQLAPLPGRLAERLSPTARAAYAQGALPDLVHADDAEAAPAEALPIRSPASLDRSATLHWLVLATACLGVFWCTSHFTDRLGKLYLVWGAVIAGFMLNSALALVQVSTRTEGLYGFCTPGAGAPWWAPNDNDLIDAPATTALRNLPDPISGKAIAPAAGAHLAVSHPFVFGTLPGGVGGFLAMGALALPLALAIVVHLGAPRGSRESWADRLGHSSQGALVVLLSVLLVLSCGLVGLASGPWFCLPFAFGLTMVGLPATIVPGARRLAFGLTMLSLLALGTGVGLEVYWADLLGTSAPLQAPDLRTSREVWTEAARIFKAFPIVGVGLGGFGAAHPYFKGHDLASTTAMSSLLQWGVEAGAVGLGLLALAGLWCLARLPGGVMRLGSMDRFLAFGLIGAVAGFSLLAVIHWTVELTAVAVSASALGGTWNRWLAGGTDLFVERG